MHPPREKERRQRGRKKKKKLDEPAKKRSGAFSLSFSQLCLGKGPHRASFVRRAEDSRRKRPKKDSAEGSRESAVVERRRWIERIEVPALEDAPPRRAGCDRRLGQHLLSTRTRDGDDDNDDTETTTQRRCRRREDTVRSLYLSL